MHIAKSDALLVFWSGTELDLLVFVGERAADTSLIFSAREGLIPDRL